jgi:hypothetical protein
MSGRISLLIVALVVLTGTSQLVRKLPVANGFDLVDKGNIRKPADVR